MTYELKSPILGFEHIMNIQFQRIDSLLAKITNKNEHFEIYLVNPYELREYSFDIPKNIQLLLDLKGESQVEVYCVLVLQKDLENSLVNFLAPIVLNHDNNTAAQIPLSMKDYPDFDFTAKLSHFIKKSA